MRAAGRAEGLRILDVGCGNGLLLAKLNRPGWILHGLEPDAGCVERVRRRLGIDVRRGVLGDRCFGPGFDVITMIHVLEHVPDPRADLAEVRRLLKPGGVFIVEVPSCDGYGFALARGRWFGLDLPRHLTHFSAHTLRRMAEASGFRIRRLHRRPMPSMDLSLIDWRLAGRPLLDAAWYAPSWFLQKLFRGSVVRMVAFRS
jgi:2-polyprenyl-3-methyl-5-hydroxy-6-metoxy-1,4-benzoquinol methylase